MGQMKGAEEFDVFEIVALLWRARWLVLGAGIVVGALGAAYAFTAEPVYYSECVLAPKSNQGTGPSPILSQLGGLGSMVGAQVGLGNNNLDRLELIVRSRDLALAVLEDSTLLPGLYPKSWDPARRAWKPGFVPDRKGAAEYLKSGVLSVTVDYKKNSMTLGVSAGDSSFTTRLLNAYLNALKSTIRENVRSDADSNRRYLEEQMANTGDPLLREKIQQLIGAEIEKAMLVSSRSFDILESPAVPDAPVSPKKKQIVAICFFLGMLIMCVALVIRHGYREFRAGRERLAAGV